MNVLAMYEFRFDGLTTVMIHMLLYVFLASIFVAMIAVPPFIVWRLCRKSTETRTETNLIENVLTQRLELADDGSSGT